MADHNGVFHRMCYFIISWIFKLSTAIYFKQIQIKGRHNIPKSGPVIFVIGPHANQFIDPVLLSQHCQRDISFLCAEKSMREPGVGVLLRSFNPIAVNRPQDNAVKGEGRLGSIDSCHVIGINTKFTKQLNVKDYISLRKGYGDVKVVDILSDTECIVSLDDDNGEPKNISTLFKSSNSRIEYSCMPHIDQETVYQKVHDKLNSGCTLGIFPEGGSHDRSEILPLKAGVAVMALGAMAKYKGLDVKIVPCGMNYSQAHTFRSRVGIEFGNPITISNEMVEDFKKGGEAKRRSCITLLDSIKDGIKAVTVNTINHETLKFIRESRRLYISPQKKPDLFELIELDRKLAIGYSQLQKDTKVLNIQGQIVTHQHFLKYFQIKDYQIPQTINEGLKTYLKLVMNSVFFLTFLLLSAPGIILNLPAAVIVDYISNKKAKDALKKSTVKIYGRDVISTWKVISCYILLPLLYALYTFATFLYLRNVDMEFEYKISVPITVWCLLPYISYTSVILYEKSQVFKRATRPFLVAISDQKNAKYLRQNYYDLSNKITEIVRENKSKIFPDIDEKPDFKETKPVSVLDIPGLSQSILESKSPNGFLKSCLEGKQRSSEERGKQDESPLIHLGKMPSNTRIRKYEHYKTSKIPKRLKRKTRHILRFDDGILNT